MLHADQNISQGIVVLSHVLVDITVTIYSMFILDYTNVCTTN